MIPYATPAPPPVQPQNTLADTVGFVPNLRLKDNLLQLAAGVFGSVVGVAAGIGWPSDGGVLIACGIAGFLVGVVLWGFGMGVLGLRRGLSKKPPR